MPGLGVRSPSSPGVGIGVGGSLAAEALGPNPNLLLWSEAFDNAAWTKSAGVTIAANVAADPVSGSTADRLTSAALNGSASQVSTTAASAGSAATLDYVLTGSWSRQEVSGTFDGLAYTFSCYLKAGDMGAHIRLQLDRSGGFLRASLIDREDGIQALAWGAQLEQAASATAYQKREGS